MIAAVLTIIIFNIILLTKWRRSQHQHSCLSQGIITVKFLEPHQGGLGNVLFQYASIYGISKKLKMKAAIPTNFSLLKMFHLWVKDETSVSLINNTHWAYASELTANTYDKYLIDHINPCVNISLVGYLQSYRYFQDVSPDIHAQLDPQRLAGTATCRLQLAANLISPSIKRPIYVGVHVRRGDMLKRKFQQLGYAVPDTSYYHRAISFFQQRYAQETLIFIVASDDLQWCKNNLVKTDVNLYFVDDLKANITDATDAELDFATLVACNHSIISVGTFSWWTGYLAGGDVVYYKNYPAPYSKLGLQFKKKDYYPQNWISLP